jgi:serine/threonine protein kinase
MSNTESFTYEVNADGRRIHVKRPLSQFAAIPAYQRLFEEEAHTGLSWVHPHILRYLQYGSDAKGPFIAQEYVPAETLHEALLEEPLGINSMKESRRIMEALFEAVSYLHSQNVLHLDITPENILITRSAHDVKLMNPASFYVGQSPSFFIYKERYAAPELFEENARPTVAADIYSLGRVMEYLFCYSKLTLGISRVIARATADNPAKRYKSVHEMQMAFRRTRRTDALILTAKVAAVFIALLFFYQMMDDGSTPSHVLPPSEDSTYARRPHTPPSTQAEDDIYSLSAIQDHIDTAYRDREVPMDEPYAATEMLKTKEEAERDAQAERIFKKEFRKRAEKTISELYTPSLMNGDEKKFMQLSTQRFTELDRLQRELGEQYNMDLILTTRLSSEVITELTEEYMRKIKK